MKILVIVFLVVMAQSAYCNTLHPESYYNEIFCTSLGGKMEYYLRDETKVDCLTHEFAIELDFAMKWAELYGHAIYCSRKSNKQPGIVLIVEDLKRDKKYIEKLWDIIKIHQKIKNTFSQDIALWLIYPSGKYVKINGD